MKHFTINEFIKSETAKKLKIDNTPPSSAIQNIETLVAKILDPARNKFGKPIYITSGYRCPQLNKAVGGTKNSYHLQGRAADLVTGSYEGNCRLFRILQAIPHTELINEHNLRWIHVAL